MGDEITYPFPNLSGFTHRRSLGMNEYFQMIFFNGCYYLYVLRLKLIYVGKINKKLPVTREMS